MTNEAKAARDLVQTLEMHHIEPEDTYTAAAGREYGSAAAYLVRADGKEQWAVRWGNNAETNYALTDDVSDLSAWLIHEDLDGESLTVERANVLGAEGVDAAPGGWGGDYMVLVTRYYYGPSEQSSLALDDDNGSTRYFTSRDEAEEWIADRESGTYILGHNESGAPSYKVVTA